MKKLHHVIAAIDFTSSCRIALREAVHRASLDGATITAVHVMDEFLVHELKKALSTEISYNRWPCVYTNSRHAKWKAFPVPVFTELPRKRV